MALVHILVSNDFLIFDYLIRVGLIHRCILNILLRLLRPLAKSTLSPPVRLTTDFTRLTNNFTRLANNFTRFAADFTGFAANFTRFVVTCSRLILILNCRY